ncbi:MAG: metallophosphoesterase [Acidobacteriota bacterium]
MKTWPFVGVALIQALLILAHWFVFVTWIAFWDPLSPTATLALRAAFFLVAFSFVAAALLSFRFFNRSVRTLYKAAAVWLGFLNFFFLAACLSWLVWFAVRLAGLPVDQVAARAWIAGILDAGALLIGIYGLVNARWIRVRRVPVELPHRPESWSGRTGVMLSDVHLGHVNGVRFSRRLTALAASFNPDVVFLPGDLFDGTEVDLDHLLAPFKELDPPFGVYFTTGNHEEYESPDHYVSALSRAGVRVLNNERVTVDGLHIVGVPYSDSTYPARVRTILDQLRPDPGQASILLNHVPARLPIVEQAGIGLQLSGHTHGGQIFPFTWLTRRVFGPFTHGLNRFGSLQVYTSTGVGTWGPPMRVGSRPEIVLLQFL